MLENKSRLTKRNSDGSVGINDFRYYNYADFQKLANKLAEFEDIGTVEELIKEHKELIELSRRYLIGTNELLEYQAIGTIDEFKALKEKNEPKKPIYSDFDDNGDDEIIPYKAVCPTCGIEFEFGYWNEEENHHCICGQKLDWE